MANVSSKDIPQKQSLSLGDLFIIITPRDQRIHLQNNVKFDISTIPSFASLIFTQKNAL